MSLVNVREYAKHLGIKIRGSLKTKRLTKKLCKHLEELLEHFWEQVRIRKGITTYIKGKTTVLGKPLSFPTTV